MHLNQDLQASQSLQEQAQASRSSEVRNSEGNFLSQCSPSRESHSAASDEPVSDMRRPHLQNILNPFTDADPQPSAQSRLDDWVRHAPTEEEQAVRAELANQFQNAGARVDEDDRLRVEESIDLEGYTELTALPVHLCVDGDFNLSGCSGLTALPDDLSVGGDLDLSDCTGLMALPNDLSVGGDLDLSDCTGLTALPDDLSVSGDLKFDQDLQPSQSLQEQPRCIVRKRNREGNLLSQCSPSRESHSAASDDPVSDIKRPHLQSILNQSTDADPQSSVQSRLDDWVRSASTEEEQAVRAELASEFQNAGARIDKDGRLRVEESIDLKGYTELTALPVHLRVDGDLNLFDFRGLTALSDDLRVDGNLDLSDCTRLTSLPNNLRVGGILDLSNCTRLTALPNDLSVGGSLNLSNCMRLTTLPNNLSVSGFLNLSDCKGLTALPDDLSVSRSLNLSGCKGLAALPNNLSVGGGLNLSNCRSLRALPEHLKVGGGLNLSNCRSLRALPEHLSVGGDLNLSYCVGLTALPNDLSVGVGGTLNLSNCSGLRALPNGLVVGGRFDLYNCRSLMDLPEHLSVGGDLYLSGCAGLTALPDDLSVGGDLYLSGCASLTALPNWFATLGRNENDGDIRQVDLTGTGLSETILNRLSDLSNPNVQFFFGHTAQEYEMFQSFHDALKSWDPEETLQPLDMHSWNLNAGQEVQLMTFLSRLHQTADAKNCNTKPNLQHRVQSFLIQMEKNQDDYRNQALERIAEGLESCDDRVILIMNDIEKLTRIREASCSENPEASLRALGQSLLALEVVHRHAAEKCKHEYFVDEIEVYLALEIKLADALNLPVSTKNMLFERCANVTEQEIAAARKEALATVNDPQKVKAYLEAWEPWQTLQRTAQARQLSWSVLPHSTASFDQSDYCLISSRSLSELEDPVAVGQVLYSLESLLTWWVQQGTDPATKLKIDLSAIKAVPKLNH